MRCARRGAGRVDAVAERGHGCVQRSSERSSPCALDARLTRAPPRRRAVLQSIGLLLAEPNPDDGLMSDIVRALA
jgi:hypothetical protein